jgi:hypothetical protein
MPGDSEDRINSIFRIEKLAIHETTKKQAGIFQTTRRYNPKDGTHHSRLSEILKSNLYTVIFQEISLGHFVYVSVLSSFSL